MKEWKLLFERKYIYRSHENTWMKTRFCSEMNISVLFNINTVGFFVFNCVAPRSDHHIPRKATRGSLESDTPATSTEGVHYCTVPSCLTGVQQDLIHSKIKKGAGVRHGNLQKGEKISFPPRGDHYPTIPYPTL